MYGAFFGSEYGCDLSFNKIALENNQLIVQTNEIATITIITDKGISKIDTDTKNTTYKIPFDVCNVPTINYVRIEAKNNDKERIFSQPIRFIVN